MKKKKSLCGSLSSLTPMPCNPQPLRQITKEEWQRKMINNRYMNGTTKGFPINPLLKELYN